MADAERARWAPILLDVPIRFAPDFLWGVASSAFQAEGGSVPNDWVAAAQAGRVPANLGNGFWERAEEDFALVANLGFGHYRFSIEWSRVEPERGRFDEGALDRYRAMCDAACASGLTPWVNLFHFTLPVWFAARGGFLNPSNHDDFRRYIARVSRALVGHTQHFHVQNESTVYALFYLFGEQPPFIADRDAALAMTRHVLALHADGYQILKSVDPNRTVATIEVYLDPRPKEVNDSGQQAAARSFDEWYHGTLLTALATGWVRVPGRDPEEIPHLKGALDVYGFNYYSSIAFGARGIGSYADRDDAPVDTMGRRVFPTGMEAGLLRITEALPGVPILVTENGCPTTDETFRIRYIAAHLAALDRARRRGADVRGYFHWTAVDNYEWQHGFSDARFGLIGFDASTGERRIRRSGEWLRRVIAAGVLNPASVA